MKIETIDKNFEIKKINNGDFDKYFIPSQGFKLFGGFYDDNYGFIKMNNEFSNEISPNVNWGIKCGAGIRLAFSTNSSKIKLTSKLFERCIMNHMPSIGSAYFTLVEVDENNKYKFVCNLTGDMFKDEEYFESSGILKNDKIRNYILYFPLYSGVIELSLEFDKDSYIKEFNPYKKDKPILYYGSSITQGGCASRSNNCYQAFIEEWTNTDFYNYGFSGSALAEDKMIEFLSDFDCSIFVCDYDYNAPNCNHLLDTHLKLYKCFRNNPKNKNTPIIFMTKPDYYQNIEENEKRKNIILDTYKYAINNKDKNVYIIFGEDFFPSDVCEHYSVDGCHPTDLGFYYMAKSLYKVIEENNLLK